MPLDLRETKLLSGGDGTFSDQKDRSLQQLFTAIHGYCCCCFCCCCCCCFRLMEMTRCCICESRAGWERPWRPRCCLCLTIYGR